LLRSGLFFPKEEEHSSHKETCTRTHTQQAQLNPKTQAFKVGCWNA